MQQIPSLINTLKQQLKAQGLTYQDVAAHLDLSAASVKRLFADGNFTLQRLEQVCNLLQLELAELFSLMQRDQSRLHQLTLQQEREIAADVLLLMITVCVINGMSFEQILERFRVAHTDCIRKLAHLDRLKILELLPNNRIRLLVSPDFHWIPNGPIQKFFQEKVEHEFFSCKFDQQHEKLVVLNGLLSGDCNGKFQQKMERLAREFVELCEDDKHKPVAQRDGTTVVLAIRHWEYSVFEDFRK